MRKLAAAVVAALPLLAVAQDAAQPAGQPAAPQPPPAAQPPQYPAQYAPPPQYTPPPPQYAPPPPQYAPQQQYAPPPGQYAQPPPQPAQQGQYAPPPQYAPPGQYAPPQQYGPPRQPPPPYLRPEKQRDRWYIGFGLGGGNGRVKFPGESVTFEDFLGDSTTPVSFNFKIGATVNPRLLLGLDLGIITAAAKYQTATGDSFERTLGIANIDGVATFFPMERGFFVRAGIGLSSLSVTDTLNGTSTDRSASGANVLAGVGYAFWLGRSFNLTVNLDVSAQSYGSSENWYADQGPDSSSFWTFGLGFDWY